jgi:hypothetical protein
LGDNDIPAENLADEEIDESKSGFRAYTHTDAAAAVEKALTDQPTEADIQLSFLAGQILFSTLCKDGSATDPLPIRGGRLRQSTLKQYSLRPYFNSWLLDDVQPWLIKRLEHLGYQLINEGVEFPLVDLTDVPEQRYARVTLALDDDLRPLRMPRPLDEDEVMRILEAATLGEVLPESPSSLGMVYHRLALQENVRKTCVQIYVYMYLETLKYSSFSETDNVYSRIPFLKNGSRSLQDVKYFVFRSP